MKGKAQDLHSNKQGIYTSGPDSVNGKTYWNHKNGKFSMWYLPKKSSKGGRWFIGKSKNLGKKMGSIISQDDVDKPQDATTWKYFNGSSWISQPRNVIVTALLNNKNSAKTNKKTSKQKSKRTPKRTTKRKTKKTPKIKTKKTPKRTPKGKTKKTSKRTTKQRATSKSTTKES